METDILELPVVPTGYALIRGDHLEFIAKGILSASEVEPNQPEVVWVARLVKVCALKTYEDQVKSYSSGEALEQIRKSRSLVGGLLAMMQISQDDARSQELTKLVSDHFQSEDMSFV